MKGIKRIWQNYFHGTGLNHNKSVPNWYNLMLLVPTRRRIWTNRTESGLIFYFAIRTLPEVYDNPTEVKIYDIHSANLDSNKIVLAYRDNKQIIDGILLQYHINFVINQNKNQVFISSENQVKIEDNSQNSDITFSGSFRFFLSKNRSIYLNYQGEKTFSINNFEAAYIDLEEIPYNYNGNSENLATIKTGNFTTLFTDSNKVILAYRSSKKIEGGCLLTSKMRKIEDKFLVFGDNNIIISKEYSNRNVIKINNSIRLFTNEGDFYISGINGKEFTLHIPADTRSAFPVISVHSPVSIQYRWQS